MVRSRFPHAGHTLDQILGPIYPTCNDWVGVVQAANCLQTIICPDAHQERDVILLLLMELDPPQSKIGDV